MEAFKNEKTEGEKTVQVNAWTVLQEGTGMELERSETGQRFAIDEAWTISMWCRH